MNDKIKIDVAGYVRCSTEMQDDSISQQKSELTKYAIQNNLNIIRWYEDEGKSGTTFLKRPAFNRLKDDVENGADFSQVLVYDESRWGRAIDPEENRYWKYHFKILGVKVRLVNSQSKQNDDMSSRLTAHIEAELASDFPKKLSVATLRGLIANALKGYSNGGTAPYGYIRVAVDKSSNKKIRNLNPGQKSNDDEKVIFGVGDPNEVKIVQRIFALRIEGLGYRNIATILNNENVPCPKRGRWKNKDQKWSANTINTMLSNLTYTGARVFNKHPQSHLSGSTKEKWINDKNDWIIVKNAHSAIIDEETFKKANISRKPYSRKNRHYFESPYLLSGLIKCKSCGFNFQGQTRKLKSKKDGSIYTVSYYEDSGYINKGKAVCKSFLIKKEDIEKYVVGLISSFIKDESFLNRIVQEVKSKLLKNSDLDILLENQKKQIENNKSILKNLLELLRNGVNLKEVEDEVYRINKEIEYYQKNYLELRSEKNNKTDIQKNIKEIKKLLNNFDKTFNQSPLHIQKNFIRQFISEILVDPASGIITCNFRKVPWIDNITNQIDILGIEMIRSRLNKKKQIKKSA